MLASIPSPGANGFEIGPFDVRYYGLAYVAAVVAAVIISGRRWKAEGGDPRVAEDVALWGFPAGLLGGRLYFVITSWDEVPDEWWGVFAIWEGGLGLPGGIAAGVLAGIWRVRRLGIDVPRFMDVAAPGILVAQAIGRLGNWFNQELYGRPTDLPWGLEIARENRPDRYADAETFHPAFLYEIVWDLGLAAALVWLGHHRRIRPPGLFALYVAGYAAFRMFIETLRVDPAKEILGLRLNFWVMGAILVAATVWFLRTQRAGRLPAAAEGAPVRERPDWLTRERGLALAGLLGLFVVGVICLAMILSAGGDDREQVAAAPAATAAPTQAPSPTPTPTPTPVPLTPAQRAERRAAAEQVRQQGYEPVSLKAYHPDQNLRVLLGEAEGGAEATGAADGRRAFFFVGGQFIGTDATEPSAELRISKQTNNTVTLRYGLNTGETARVRFKWEAGTLSPQTLIPPALERQG